MISNCLIHLEQGCQAGVHGTLKFILCGPCLWCYKAAWFKGFPIDLFVVKGYPHIRHLFYHAGVGYTWLDMPSLKSYGETKITWQIYYRENICDLQKIKLSRI